MKTLFNSKSSILACFLIFITLLIITVIGSMFDIYRFPSSSMEPTLRKNDIVIIRNWPIHSLKAGTLVVSKAVAYKPPIPLKHNVDDYLWLRRIAGEPGDKVYWNAEGVYNPKRENELISIGKPRNSPSDSDHVVELKENEYFLIGDNYRSAIDSRHFGPVHADDIIGEVTSVINR